MFRKKLQDNKALLFIITSKFIESSLSYFLKWHTQFIKFFFRYFFDDNNFSFFSNTINFSVGVFYGIPCTLFKAWFSKTIVNNSMY